MKKIAATLPIIWLIIVVILHVMQVPMHRDSEIRIPFADKIVHFSMFFILAFLWLRSGQYHFTRLQNYHYILLFFGCVVFGGIMEFIQGIVPSHRESDILDWCADVAGSAAGLLIGDKNYLPFIFRHQIRKAA
jgi:VanZ family protein